MGYDLVMILAIILIPLIAQLFVSATYNKYKKIASENNLSGFEIARKILDKNGLEKVHIVENKGGKLSDHYDPSRKVVRLSTEVFHGETVAAAAIAAHEVGHAIQDKEGYLYMKFRAAIFPVVNIATSISYLFILGGFFFEAVNLFYIGIAFVSLGLVFQLVTLPVEFDASRRAKRELQNQKLLMNNENEGAKQVLNAAAMTYVAGVLAAGLQILRYVLLFNGRRD